ncbi:fumarylacetoacetate hydrolase family protein [Starkeya sp. ORNL1]|uniref:fumarylacetoacetate hydrolase family protein n=1 Tax=Starkeya sp. ORNL1 TaxID=2709380 RepID=UPI0014645A53|nr:fumarylacetoacetate hydrolase family protein [Starkeya sp. ORNL1]QJP16954.1 fumarylacetoacetate hydrolase family protein [Starkeya sp. ORNL1]
MFTLEATLPVDAADAVLVGRVWLPAAARPAVVTVRGSEIVDLSEAFDTITDVLDAAEPAKAVAAVPGNSLGGAAEIIAGSVAGQHKPDRPHLLAPCDLQAIKAAGVTFVKSLLERLIEEDVKGDMSRADESRHMLEAELGTELARLRPGSDEALELRRLMKATGRWSQYLEVGLGPYAEIFTKAQPMSAVGTGAEIGIHRASTWNNPEPEIVLAVNGRNEVVGATLGNDVNLRDFEGRSALLLGRAKDNNASCAIGPFIRLFDAAFDMDDVRDADVELTIRGEDGFTLREVSHMAEISRDPLDLVQHATGLDHQYPDGFVLFLGTMFAPTADRGVPGLGFTHKVGDVVSIATPKLGTLANRVNYADAIEPWSYGIRALMKSLALRNA